MVILKKFYGWLMQCLWVQLVYNPFHALDLTDKDGKTDHGKVLPALLLGAAIVAQFFDKQFTSLNLIILGSLAYGYGAWRTFIKSRSVTGNFNSSTSTSLQHTITETLERRDPDQGIDPTHE